MEPSVYNYSGVTGLWSLQSGGAPLRLREDMSIRGLAFSRDGKRLATASQDETQEGRSSGTLDGQVRLWDVETAKSRALLNGGQRVWSTPTQEGPDAEDGVEVTTIPESSATKVAFIPGSGDLVAGVYQLSAETWEGITWVEFESVVHLTFWDPQSGTELKSMDTERSELHAMVVDPDGKILATGHELGQLLLWDISTGEKLHEVPSERADRMDVLAFHPDGSVLVSGDSEGRLIVWNPQTGEELRRLSDHPEGVTDIAFNATGTLLASGSCGQYGSSTGRTRLRYTSSFEVLFELEGCPTVVLFTPDSRFLIVGDRDGVTRFHEVETGQLVVSLALHPNIDAWLVWTPDGLYDGNAEGIERILVWRRGKEVRRLTEFSSRYHVADLLPKALSGTLNRPERPITELPIPK
jgi:WD40 repeat protein